MTVTGVDRVAPVQQEIPANGAIVWFGLLGLLAVIVAGLSLAVDGIAPAGTDIQVYHGGAAVAVWAAVSTFALEAVIWILVGAAGVTSRRTRALSTLAGTVAALPLGPLSSNFWTGQINTILVLLVVADLMRGPGRFRGIGVGIAAGLKLTPLIFIPYLLLTRQRRAGIVALASFAGTVLVSLVLLPADSVRYWFDSLLDITRVIPVGDAWIFNQSMLATVNRIPGAPGALWFVLAAIVGVGGLAVAVLFRRRGDELAGIVACALTGLLVSPVSWPFHWVWCVPLLMLWAARAWRRDLVYEKVGVVGLWLAFAASSAWTFTVFFSSECGGAECGKVTQPGLMKLLFADLFVIIGIAALAVMAVHLLRHSRPVLPRHVPIIDVPLTIPRPRSTSSPRNRRMHAVKVRGPAPDRSRRGRR